MRTKIYHIISFLIVLTFVVYFINSLDVESFSSYFEKINYNYVWGMFGFAFLQLVLRSKIWHLILERKTPYKESVKTIGISQMLNIVFPARVGEFYKIFSFGKKTDIPKTSVLSFVVVERIFDSLVILLLTTVVLLSVGFKTDLYSVIITAGSIYTFMILMILLFVRKKDFFKMIVKKIIRKESLVKFLGEKMDDIAEAFISIGSLKKFITLALFFILVWISLLFQTHLFILSSPFASSLPWYSVFVLLLMLVFSMFLPATPSGVGITHYVAIIFLKIFISGESTEFINYSLAFSVMFHLAMNIPELFWGFLLYLKEFGFKIFKNDIYSELKNAEI